MSLFIGTEEQGGQQYKKNKGSWGREGTSRLLGVGLGASGDLLQVMDALLVNHADVEGGEVEDEAPVQLEGDEGGSVKSGSRVRPMAAAESN